MEVFDSLDWAQQSKFIVSAPRFSRKLIQYLQANS